MIQFKVGPEDIGKVVYIKPVNKIGIITSWTAEWVSVLLNGNRSSTRFRYHECHYVASYIRHR